MYKIFLILFLMLSLSARTQEAIQLKTTYNEASARIEAFKDVEQKVKKEFYKKYLKDPNRKENLEFIKKGILQTNLGRELCPFYLKDTLVSYSITYLETPQYNFYYNILGSLAKFDIIKDNDYPRKILGYSRYGNLMSVSFEADKNEQFVYDENGKLIAHWLDDVALDKDNKTPKLFKLKRGKQSTLPIDK